MISAKFLLSRLVAFLDPSLLLHILDCRLQVLCCTISRTCVRTYNHVRIFLKFLISKLYLLTFKNQLNFNARIQNFDSAGKLETYRRLIFEPI